MAEIAECCGRDEERPGPVQLNPAAWSAERGECGVEAVELAGSELAADDLQNRERVVGGCADPFEHVPLFALAELRRPVGGMGGSASESRYGNCVVFDGIGRVVIGSAAALPGPVAVRRAVPFGGLVE